MTNQPDIIKDRVMQAIAEQKVQMRPRWQFALYSTLMICGSLILLLFAVYIVSLGIFLLRHSGGLEAPIFGMRGWIMLLRDIPGYLLTLTIVFLAVLYALVRRFSFFYRTPIVAALVAMVLFVFLAGFILERTMIHRRLAQEGDHGWLPRPLGAMYAGFLHPAPPPGAFRGVFLATSTGGYIMRDQRDGTTTILVGRFTRLPYGTDFDPGDEIEVIGDRVGSSTIRALGVIKIED